MKKLIINIVTILIIVGAVIFLQYKFFPNEIDVSTHTSDTIWKDSLVVEYYPDPYPVYIDTGSVKIVELPADSAGITEAYLALHKDFFSTYHYSDTLKDDTIAFIKVDAQITQNKPIKYTLGYFDRTPSIVNNTTNIYAQNEFYVGITNTSPSLLFKHKKGWMIGAGYDLVNEQERIKVHAYYNFNKIFR